MDVFKKTCLEEINNKNKYSGKNDNILENVDKYSQESPIYYDMSFIYTQDELELLEDEETVEEISLIKKKVKVKP